MPARSPCRPSRRWRNGAGGKANRAVLLYDAALAAGRRFADAGAQRAWRAAMEGDRIRFAREVLAQQPPMLPGSAARPIRIVRGRRAEEGYDLAPRTAAARASVPARMPARLEPARPHDRGRGRIGSRRSRTTSPTRGAPQPGRVLDGGLAMAGCWCGALSVGPDYLLMIS